MRNKRVMLCFRACLVLLPALLPALAAGKAQYGKVTEVRSANVVILDVGTERHVIRIVGIDAPTKESIASEAKQFVANLVLGKNALMRFASRAENGDMFGQLLTDDSVIGIKDVGLELVRNGMARRQRGEDYQFGYKYGELSAAEREAQQARRGLWATTEPR
jgi:endonuclease YncB( thermonuclease family)